MTSVQKEASLTGSIMADLASRASVPPPPSLSLGATYEAEQLRRKLHERMRAGENFVAVSEPSEYLGAMSSPATLQLSLEKDKKPRHDPGSATADGASADEEEDEDDDEAKLFHDTVKDRAWHEFLQIQKQYQNHIEEGGEEQGEENPLESSRSTESKSSKKNTGYDSASFAPLPRRKRKPKLPPDTYSALTVSAFFDQPLFTYSTDVASNDTDNAFTDFRLQTISELQSYQCLLGTQNDFFYPQQGSG